MGRVTESVIYRVKNTLVEIGRGPAHVVEEEYEHDHARGCLAWGADSQEIKAAPAPYITTQETSYTLGKNSLAWVPDTPSPFLHPAHFIDSAGVVPHMGLDGNDGINFGEDMALPPAFGDGDAQYGMGFDGQGMDGYYGLPAMMYDPASGSYGWCMPMDGMQQGSNGEGGENDNTTDQGMLEGQGVNFEPQQDEHSQQPGWCPDGGMIMDQQDQQGCLDAQGWGTDGNMPMEQGSNMMEATSAEQDITTQQILEALVTPQVIQEGHQGWVPEGGMPMDSQGCQMGDQLMGGAMVEMLPDGQGWNADIGATFDQDHPMLQDVQDEGQWCTDGTMAIEQDCGFKDSQDDGQGWGPDGQEGRSGAAWRGKGSSRGGRGRHVAHEEPLTPSRDGSNAEAALVQNGCGSEARGDELQNAGCGEVVAGGCTTVMLRNIPNKYTREMLVKQLTQDFRGRFDFVYLPIDFKNRCNVGYGFINFRTPDACEEFVNKFNGVDVRKCLPGLNSRKVCEVTPARVQGLDENVRRLRNGPVMNELVHHPEWMPLLLDGSGEERPFPLPDQPCPPVKPRRRAGREDTHGGGSTGAAGGTSSGGGRDRW